MSKRLVAVLTLFILMVLPFLFVSPQHSGVIVELDGLEKDCYATLLSDTSRSGPNSASSEYSEWSGISREIWDAFSGYANSDPFYFLGKIFSCSPSHNQVVWRDFPPETYKLLVYFPETDSYAVSAVKSSYAYSSYFTVDMQDAANAQLELRRSYPVGRAALTLLLRAAVMVVVDLCAALLFCARKKLKFVLGLSLCLRLLQSLMMNVAVYYADILAFFLLFGWLVICSLGIQLAAYRPSQMGKKAVLAPLLSAAVSVPLLMELFLRLPPDIWWST